MGDCGGELRLAQVGATQVREDEIRLAEIQPLQCRTGQHAPTQIAPKGQRIGLRWLLGWHIYMLS
jgi:hypothetical protein